MGEIYEEFAEYDYRVDTSICSVRNYVLSDYCIDFPYRQGKTMLHCVCLEGNFKAVYYLAEEGARIDRPSDKTKRTPLHYAVISRNKNIIALLIDEGVQRFAKDAFGLTPADYTNDPILKDFVLKYTKDPWESSQAKRRRA